MATLVFKGRIFDGERLHPQAVLSVDTEKGVITGLGEIGSIEVPNGAKVIEGKEMTILPGLIDAHVHFYSSKGTWPTQWAMVPDTLAVLRAAHDLKRLLQSGFTCVRELGSKGATHLAQAVEEGSIEGPDVISCSRALAQTGGDDDPHVFPLDIGQELASYSYFCDGPWECRRAVRKVVRDGGKVVKLYASGEFKRGRIRTNFTPEELNAIVEESHAAGLRVAAHAEGEEALNNVIHAGVDSIEHGSGLTASTASEIAKLGIFYVPTLVTYNALSSPNIPEPLAARIKEHMTDDMELAKEHGIAVVAGSDIVGDTERPHGRNFEEIAAISRTLGNEEAIVCATSRAAKCLDIADCGILKAGLKANVLAVRGNPLEDIHALAPEAVEYVLKSGRLVFSR